MNFEQTIGQFPERRQERILEFLAVQGVDVSNGETVLRQLPLKTVASLLGMGTDSFEGEYQKWNSRQELLHFTANNEQAELYARIPCVVQLPIQEYLDANWGKQGCYNIALAEFGMDWLAPAFDTGIPRFFIGVGIEGMVREKHLEQYEYGWDGYERPLNADFSGMEDPRSRFRILSCIPLVLVADRSQAQGRAVPRRFCDLLNPEYERSIVYPDDGHMLNGILMTYLYKQGGEEAVHTFRRNILCSAHPSEMIKPGGLPVKPFLMLMPWIFGRLKAAQSHMELVWFEDGVPILPIVITARQAGNGDPETRELLLGKGIGEVFRTQGFFPSANAEVSNDLPGKLSFIGWEFLYRRDLPEIIRRCREIVRGNSDSSSIAEREKGSDKQEECR